jgi:hypothetical protein
MSNEFESYYHAEINETIDDLNMHELVETILSADIAKLSDYNDDLITERTIDPSIAHTKIFRVACKAVARGIQKCRHRGEKLVVDIGQPMTVFGVIGSVMEGMIIGDEWAKRVTGK